MLQRFLDEDELRSLGQTNTFAIKFEGTVDPELLKRAVCTLCDSNPVLRARVKKNNGKYVLSADSDIDAELVQLEGGISELETFLRLNPFDPGERLIRFYLTTIGVKEAIIAIRSDHCVADAHFYAGVLLTFLQVYSNLLSGHEPKIENYNDLPKSPHKLLQESGGTILPPSEFKAIISPRARLEFAQPERAVRRSVSARISHTDTSNVIALSRRLGTSVNALISSALMLTMRNRDTRTGMLPIAYSSAIDLRNKVDPKLSPLHASNAMFNHMSHFELPKDPDIADLSHAIKAQVQKSIASLKLFSPWPSFNLLHELSHDGINTLYVSTPGVYDIPRRLNGLKIGHIIQPGIRFPERGHYESKKAILETQATALNVTAGWWTSDGELFIICSSVGPESMNHSLIQDSVTSLLYLASQ